MDRWFYHWCQREGVHANDRADVGQEVFRAVAMAIGRFDRRPGVAFAAWLRTITRNKAIDYLRRQSQLPRAIGGSDFRQRMTDVADNRPVDTTTEPAPSRDEDPLASAILAHGTLAEVKDRFTEQSWKAFWETAVNDRSSAEVADELGMTAMAVRKAKSRVLRCLRQELATHDLEGATVVSHSDVKP